MAEKFIEIQIPPKILLAFEEHGKEGESLVDFIARLVLYFQEENVKPAMIYTRGRKENG